jgi:hypothetical protein
VELLRETVNTPRELEALTGSPVLASLPKDRSARRALIVEKRRLSLPKSVEPEEELRWAAGE